MLLYYDTEAKEIVSHEQPCMDAGLVQSFPGTGVYMYIYGSCVCIVCFQWEYM